MSQETTLRDLVSLSLEITSGLFEGGGELTAELQEKLSTLDLKLPQKVDSYAIVLERLKSEADFWKSKADEYYKASENCTKAAEYLKQNLKVAMANLKTDELVGDQARIYLKNTTPRVIITGEVDSHYVTTEVVTKIDKKKMADDLKLGVPVKGAHLEATLSLAIGKPVKGMKAKPNKELEQKYE